MSLFLIYFHGTSSKVAKFTLLPFLQMSLTQALWIMLCSSWSISVMLTLVSLVVVTRSLLLVSVTFCKWADKYSQYENTRKSRLPEQKFAQAVKTLLRPRRIHSKDNQCSFLVEFKTGRSQINFSCTSVHVVQVRAAASSVDLVQWRLGVRGCHPARVKGAESLTGWRAEPILGKFQTFCAGKALRSNFSALNYTYLCWWLDEAILYTAHPRSIWLWMHHSTWKIVNFQLYIFSMFLDVSECYRPSKNWYGICRSGRIAATGPAIAYIYEENARNVFGQVAWVSWAEKVFRWMLSN